MSRWFFFLLTITIGLAGGLYFGWFIQPVKYENTSPDSLRIDYKTDYVLMVAEAYQLDNDLPLAMRRLTFLGDASPEVSVQQAIRFANTYTPSYPPADLALINKLALALESRPTTSNQAPESAIQP
jgi:hypothetical protein